MNRYVEGLRQALDYWRNPVEDKGLNEKRAVKLAYFNIFTAREITKIVPHVSKERVEQLVRADVKKRNEQEEVYYKNNWYVSDFLVFRNSQFAPKTLDALLDLAEYRRVHWQDDSDFQPKAGLIRLITANGTSLNTISALTNIPLAKLREVTW